MIMNKRVKLVFVDGDENAFDGIKNISCEALIGDNVTMPVTVQVSAKTSATYNNIASNLYDKLLLGEKIADIIIAVAMPDEKGINLGIMNRLKRSCDSGEL